MAQESGVRNQQSTHVLNRLPAFERRGAESDGDVKRALSAGPSFSCAIDLRASSAQYAARKSAAVAPCAQTTKRLLGW